MNLAAQDPSGEQPFLPRFELLEPLGEGAVATVYKVRAVRDGSLRALKALKAEQAKKPDAIKRFRDEFQILNRLYHPSLPDVYDYGIAGTASDGIHYIVMELVDGVPIDQYFSGHKDDLWLLIYELTEALSFIHEHDLLHLDLKPENILVRRTRAFGNTESPVVTLIDFGLSYQRDVGGEIQAVGTAHYMPPEIIRRDDKLTRAADYYSLGVILYELIEGKPPFDGSVHDILQAHLSRTVTFSAKQVEYAELYTWVERLVSKMPNERLEAFQEFRRMVATRLGEVSPDLERAYALGYIESLGMFGKRGVWEELKSWAGELTGVAVDDGTPAKVDVPPSRAVDHTSSVLDASAKDLEATIRKDLLSSAGERAEAAPDTSVRDRKRYVALSGPPSSGKSYMMEALRAEVRPRGAQFLTVDDPARLEELLDATAKRRAGSVDPSAIVFDRFVHGWERLLEMGKAAGLVLVVDDWDRMPTESREFLEYVIKRMELLISDGEEPGIVLVAAGVSPKMKASLANVVNHEDSIIAFDVPSPGRADVEGILSRFHGRMPVADQRQHLGDYLSNNLESDGAVMLALREAVAFDDLRYEFGQWHFHPSGDAAMRHRSTTAEYYRKVFPELREESRELVRWVCCHKGRLTQRQIEDLSGLDAGAVDTALENIRPYRFIEVTTENGNVHLAFASEDVRNAFYEMPDASDRRAIHECYVLYLEGYKDRRVSGLESLAYHYERAGMVRQALLTRVKAIKKAKRQKEVNALRRLCEDGIAFVRGTESERSLWHAERYFIKNLVDAAWATNNYKNLVAIVDGSFAARNRKMPPGLIYKYGFSLISAGDFERCSAFLEECKANPQLPSSREAYNYTLLVESCLLYETARSNEALPVLNSIKPKALPLAARARYYIYCMLTHQAMGDFKKRKHYMQKAKRAAGAANNKELLLRINYNITMFLLNRAEYDEARTIIRRSIRIANRRRLYRSLSTMYFLAAMLYHEEANQAQALRYLDKAIAVASDIGMADHVLAYIARHSLIHRTLGQYGTSLRYLEHSRRALPVDDKQYFFASVIMLDVLVTLNSRLATQLVGELEKLVGLRKGEQVVGHYRRFLGDYKRQHGDYEGAVLEYEHAVDIYRATKAHDDEVRTQVALGNCILAQDQYEEALHLRERLREPVKKLNSSKIDAEYAVFALELALRSNSDSTMLQEALEECKRRRKQAEEMKDRLAIDAALFRAYAYMERGSKAVQCFGRFYSGVKDVCSNLPDSSFVDDYLSDSRLVDLIQEFRALKEKTQASG